MKDHRVREIVNQLTAIANKYAGTQQLREHISSAIVAIRAEQDRDTRHACAEVVSNMVIVPDDQDVVNAIMNTKVGERSNLCVKHKRFPCRECDTKHFDGCECGFCRDNTKAV